MRRRVSRGAVTGIALVVLLVAVGGCGGGSSAPEGGPPTKESIAYEKEVAVAIVARYPEKAEELLLRVCPGDSAGELLARARKLHATAPGEGPRLKPWNHEVAHIC
jgi:hypothetical protein